MRAGAKRLFLILALVGLLLLVGDLARAPGSQWSGAAAVGVIHAYQRTAAPLLGKAGVRCRFTPSCSHYAEASIQRHGLLGGGWRAARRMVKCGPWTKPGTVDPPE